MRALLAVLILTGVIILGCGGLEEAAEQWAAEQQPVPPTAHLADIVGVWQGEGVTLVIDASGLMEHEKSTGGSNTSFNAPILVWTDAGFSAGIGPIRQDFAINVPPAQVEGVWTMTVNSHVLTRQ